MPNPGTRKSDYWYSRNKVLGLSHVTGRKPHARNPNFDTEETKLLISLWGDPNVQKTLITTHKKSPVIEKLAHTMRAHGYYRSPEEINTRLKNLKCIYNRLKKDLDLGILTETTWKHYSSMEEILNRPIFGRDAAQERVRQQEMQFKLKLEKANNDKAFISTDSLAFLKDFIDEGDEDDDDDDEFGDDEADMDEDEYDPEMTTDESSSDSKPDTKSEVVKTNQKEMAPAEIKIENEPLIIPKEEPIDVDDPEMQITAEIIDTRKPPEPQYKIKIASVSTSPATTTTNKITITSQPQTTLKFTQAQYVMSTPTTTNASAGKISLVPTNILLKPQSQQTSGNLTFKPQQFVYTKAANQAGTIQTQMTNMSMPITTGTTNSGMPMKLLLVNRVPQNMNQSKDNIQTQTILQTQPTAAHTIAHTTTPAPAQVNATPATIKSITPVQSVSQLQPIRPKILGSDCIRKPTTNVKPKTYTPKCNIPGVRTLLNQIVQVEQQNLEINRQRLEMEKQRFEFEKSMAEKFLAILPNMQFNHNSNTNNTNHNNNSNNANGESGATTTTNGDGGENSSTINEIFCLSPKMEIQDDD